MVTTALSREGTKTIKEQKGVREKRGGLLLSVEPLLLLVPEGTAKLQQFEGHQHRFDNGSYSFSYNAFCNSPTAYEPLRNQPKGRGLIMVFFL